MKNLTETDINRIVKKIINEDIDREKMLEIVDDVINRLKEHGMKYYRELDSLNFKYPTEKYKRLAPPKRGDFELPKGVKVSRSAFPDES
jgi:chromosome condensin MukBEF MukE localization factor